MNSRNIWLDNRGCAFKELQAWRQAIPDWPRGYEEDAGNCYNYTNRDQNRYSVIHGNRNHD